MPKRCHTSKVVSLKSALVVTMNSNAADYSGEAYAGRRPRGRTCVGEFEPAAENAHGYGVSMYAIRRADSGFGRRRAAGMFSAREPEGPREHLLLGQEAVTSPATQHTGRRASSRVAKASPRGPLLPCLHLIMARGEPCFDVIYTKFREI